MAGGVLLSVNYDDWGTKPKLIEQKRAFVTEQMRDPATVQFKDEILSKRNWLCGQMNSKNAYGAYVGFKRFAVFDYDNAWIEGFGYAGKPDAQSTKHIIEMVQAQIKVSERVLVAVTADPKAPTPSKREVEAMAELELFDERWKKNCT